MVRKLPKITHFQRKYLGYSLGSKKGENYLQVCPAHPTHPPTHPPPPATAVAVLLNNLGRAATYIYRQHWRDLAPGWRDQHS
jgi:hypothetical protein